MIMMYGTYNYINISGYSGKEIINLKNADVAQIWRRYWAVKTLLNVPIFKIELVAH